MPFPAGPFPYQEGETRKLPTYSISHYPIPNCQCQAFVDDGGSQEERWWRDLEEPEPEKPRCPMATAHARK